MKTEIIKALSRYRAGTDTKSDRLVIEEALEAGRISLEDIPGFAETQEMVDLALHRDLRMSAHRLPDFLNEDPGNRKIAGRRTKLLPELLKAAVILLVGIMAGFLLRGAQDTDVKMGRMPENIAELRGHLLDQPIAMKRLEFVRQAAYDREMNDPGIHMLYYSLVSDPNINVRLAALQSMAAHLESPRVLQALIRSIPVQDAPLVQLRLAEMLLAAGARKAAEPLFRWIESSGMDGQFKEDFMDIVNQLRVDRRNI